MRQSLVVQGAPFCGIRAVSRNRFVRSQAGTSFQESFRAIMALACLAGITLLTSCGTSGSSGSSSGGGTLAVTANNGSLQNAAVSTAFANPLVAVVTTGGKPTAGVAVTFTAPSSGASGTFANGTATETDTSNSSGLATSSKFTANSTTGTYTVTATASGASSSGNFSLTNLAAAQLVISPQNGSMQSATVSTAFTTKLAAVVTNNGAGVSNVTVIFTAPSTGASGTFANGTDTESDVTNSSGVATSSTFTANATAGTYSVSATVTGGSTPATFSLTNTAAPVIAINAQSGSLQSSLVGTTFASNLTVVVTQNGSTLSGATVTFTAPSSGASGTFAQNNTATDTETTNSSGIATATNFSANGTPGTFNVSATVAGASTPAEFSLTSFTTSALTISAANGSMQSAVVNTAFATQLSAVVTYNGSPVSNVVVTFTAPSSGASGTFQGSATTQSVSTDSTGTAAATITANGTPGTYAVTASISGNSSPASYSLTNYNLGISATGGTPQSAKVSTAFGSQLSATVVDNKGNPVSGAAVTFTAPTSGASGTFSGGNVTEMDTTNSSGVATSSTFTANATAGSYTVAATVAGGAAAASFSLTNTTTSVAGIFATGGITQRAAVSTAFQANLVATVLDGSGNPISGVQVTFTAPASGASGTFKGGTATETDTSDANGHATSSVFTANGTPGAYSVMAANGATSASFSLTNSASAVTAYTFYLSGQEVSHSTTIHTPNYYAVAGAITVDQSTGNVTGGEEDYNDGNGYTYANVAISSGTLSVSSTTGQGTLVLQTANNNLGVSGQETFGVQFVNSNHALIMQFDGSATSSGTMDFQNLNTAPSGGLAFAFSGVDPAYDPVALGGVLLFNGSLLSPSWSGTIDVNDATIGLITDSPFTAKLTAVDAYGRGQITGVVIGGTTSLTLNYYQVGPEALRVIDMDTSIAAIGSAFGQGTNASNATPAGLVQSVFGIAGTPGVIGTASKYNGFGALGQFTTNSSLETLAGVADEKELTDNFVMAASISGTYTVATNGYGSIDITSANLGSVTSLGLYLTDPNLNLNDPNNTSSGMGGALLLDLDTALPGGVGFVVPQTDTTIADFNGNYAVGWQDLNNFFCADCEFDILGQGTMTYEGNLSLSGEVSDPFGTMTSSPVTSGDTFQSEAPVLADTASPGRYTMLGSNTPENLFQIVISAYAHEYNTVVYQASGTQLFWLDVDSNATNSDSSFLGVVEQQGSLSGLPLDRKGKGNMRLKQGESLTEPVRRKGSTE